MSSGTAAALSVLLLIIDAKNGVILNASAEALAKRRAEKEAAAQANNSDVVRVYASKYTSGT